ncbi:flagellar basal body L-ring protein FlgH [Paenibacillus sp. DS2015]|uniref:hypothetical protein n=1 Tax=Paenibacillus sp. DS2015 TaxID=3373917 RepID=UPI003D1A27AF
MKKIILMAAVSMLVCSVLLTGCSENTIEQPTAQEAKPTQEDIVEVKEDQKKKFSYLEQLPLEKQKKYERFAGDKETSHLLTFSPEEILLIYIHATAMSDIEVIYALTYDSGSLPDLDTFKEEYNDKLAHRDMETALQYRYYDSIEVQEDTVKQNELTIMITATIERFTGSIAYGLKLDNNVWKMDIYHLIEE